jgi:integrase
VNGKTVRTTIGRFGVYTVKQAQEEARELVIRMGKGTNPNREKEQRRVTGLTFGEALDMHLGSNKKRSARTLTDYRYLSDQYLSDWLTKPLSEITRKDCRERHQKIARDCEERRGKRKVDGRYVANHAFRVFRAAYNGAMKIHEELGANPTIGVDWFPEDRRKAAIPSANVATWHKEVMSISNPIRRDYLRFVLFTGLRRTSAATVEWSHVDIDNRALLIPQPKSQVPFMLPLSDELIALLKARQKCETTKAFFPKSKWVFPAKSKSGHIAEPKEKLGTKFTIHGLRNTFATVAESLDVSKYSIKMLVNHSLSDTNDVTAGYISIELERLRVPMQQITDKIKALCSGKVVAKGPAK